MSVHCKKAFTDMLPSVIQKQVVKITVFKKGNVTDSQQRQILQQSGNFQPASRQKTKHMTETHERQRMG